jgi:Zn-dependent M28 family amino/carboxypeptidase
MKLLDLIKKVEGLSVLKRGEMIESILKDWKIGYSLQKYATGQNIFVKEEGKKNYIVVSCHFDVVPMSPGANDNGSSIAVCLDLLRKLKDKRFKNFGLIVAFFDEEETGLHGSRAWIKEYGISDVRAQMNLEMLGMGDKFALWSLTENSKGKVLETFEKVVREEKIFVKRFDKIVTNIADHMTFRDAGLEDSFSITCISDKELELAHAYYQAMTNQASVEQLKEIMRQAPLFVHYHRPTDKTEHLNETSLQMAADAVWKTLERVDKESV